MKMIRGMGLAIMALAMSVAVPSVAASPPEYDDPVYVEQIGEVAVMPQNVEPVQIEATTRLCGFEASAELLPAVLLNVVPFRLHEEVGWQIT